MACTMYRVSKGLYQCFTSTLGSAEHARKHYPQLKGGRIKNVLQMLPSSVLLGRLYRDGELQPLLVQMRMVCSNVLTSPTLADLQREDALDEAREVMSDLQKINRRMTWN